MRTLENIRLATAYAGKFAFWKNKCLVQSLAARRMLSRRRIASTLSLGVKHDDRKKTVAHAWLTAEGIEIVAKGGDYVELKTF